MIYTTLKDYRIGIFRMPKSAGKIITDLGEISFRAFTPRNRMLNLIDVDSTEKKNVVKAEYQWDFLPDNPASPRSQVFPDIQKVRL